jgi:hypothetical protein
MASSAQRRVVDLDRLQVFGHHLQHLGVDDQLLEAGCEPALQPAGRVVHQVGPAHHGTPQRHRALVRGLGIDGVRGRGVRRPERQAVATCQLTAGLRRLGVLGRAEGRRARLRMSTLEVNEPYTVAQPGRTNCTSVATASISAFCSARAPASVAGAIAPASVNGVMHTA